MALDKNDHEESQPLLGDIERDVEAQVEAPVHVCARCASEIRGGVAFEDPHRRHHRITARGLLLASSIIFCVVLFVLSIVNMATGYDFFVGELFVCLWAFFTEFVVATLIYAGWRRRKVGKFMLKLSKNTTQIAVLCLLALSWIPITTGTIIEANRACSWGWYRECTLFVLVDIFVWFLMIALSGAAFATYRRAVKMHGRELVDNPNKIPAWRLSEVNSVEGAVKL
ncbi:hypothetical protein HMN09_00672300 [Mycena chlorophos]|uniref:Uncharacterized protein n=1 Tax=Mycena chlorophos TaxID=658473 RepID=A0A8H6WDB7_MYCCL|nr:hypothetical protein HMN09_00672300 [Mycena chlorophos]